MNRITQTQERAELAKQIIRALREGETIVESIAKGDCKWRERVRPAREMAAELYACAEECKREGGEADGE